MDKEDLILLHLQQIEAKLNEQQLTKQGWENLRYLQFNEIGYNSQKSSIMYLFLGTFLSLAFILRSILLAIDVILFTVIFMIYRKKSYEKKKKDFLTLYQKVKEYENFAGGLVDKVSHKLISKNNSN